MNETYEFWRMVLSSPVAIALSGGISGSLITLIIALCKFNHDAKESQKRWERREMSRKEKRLYNNKIIAFKQFADCYKNILTCNNVNINFLYSLILISTFYSDESRIHIKQLLNMIVEYSREVDENKKLELQLKIVDALDIMHENIMNELDRHN